MRSPLPWLLAAFLIGGSSGLYADGPAGAEPFWDSRPLSFWMRALGASDPVERRRAADAVTQIAIAHGGDAAGPAVPALQAILDERSADLRRLSATALEQIGPPAAASVPALLRVFQHDDAATVRRSAGLALARIAPFESDVIDAAAAAIRTDTDAGARTSAAVVLIASGPAGRRAVPTLAAALVDRDASVRLYAAAALAQLSGSDGAGERAQHIVLQTIQNNDNGLRAEAVAILPDVARGRADLLAILSNTLHDADPEVRAASARAIATLGRTAESLIPTLWAMLQDPDEGVREHALIAIHAIKTDLKQ
jgi:HEAT repeat protein